ncbi:glutathione S-transferase family protein [Leptospira sp. 201903070]|uniref:Glutathione S-transferase family protein n=1 Tax=Leptospira ainlahdjerensis TaxID=2810033 RepID=A0ABS2UB84_9LEPT|nr:glutathione S-transferase family protein [Leptospira ainlahdjerensis]MBM9576185.1 glutathione S-transferase family protein [Leptospira ainlahdjerensis]
MTIEKGIILHHYPASPYSERVRLFLGYKKATWKSVITPITMPKPDQTILTGGYRRAPVLQIGSDIYCDSRLILEELNRILPEPPISIGNADAASANLLAELVDADVFLKVAKFVMGSYAQKLPQELVDDRAAMQPQEKMTRENMEKLVPYLQLSLSKILPEFAKVLAKKEFFGGEIPARGDFAIYQIFWFLNTIRKFKPLVPGNENLHEWFARMKTFGAGESILFTAEDALKTAAESSPQRIVSANVLPEPYDLRAGQEVIVHPEHYDHERIFGKLVHLDDEMIILANESPKTGLVHVHFPRLRYLVLPKSS